MKAGEKGVLTLQSPGSHISGGGRACNNEEGAKQCCPPLCTPRIKTSSQPSVHISLILGGQGQFCHFSFHKMCVCKLLQEQVPSSCHMAESGGWVAAM